MLTLLLFSCQTGTSPGSQAAADSDSAAYDDTAARDDTAADPDTDPLELGEPITASPGTWTWVDFPDSSCDDGTPTGIGLNIGTSDNLVVFLEGGGACWDATTCLLFKTTTSGPFGQAEFDARGEHDFGLLSRDNAENPFKDWSMVVIPYCTGDLHTGSIIASYDAGDGPVPYHHTGHSNVLAYLKRLGATFAAPTQVAVTGTSSGGAGTLLNYPDFRRTWPDARMLIIDDSAPLLVGDAMPATLRAAWESAWDLGPLLASICGDAPCEEDLSGVHTALASRYPSDRMALLSSLQDHVYSSFVGLSGDAYQAELELLASEVFAPSGTWKPFYVEGDTHSLLLTPGTVASHDQSLMTWLTQMVTGDEAWSAAD